MLLSTTLLLLLPILCQAALPNGTIFVDDNWSAVADVSMLRDSSLHPNYTTNFTDPVKQYTLYSSSYNFTTLEFDGAAGSFSITVPAGTNLTSSCGLFAVGPVLFYYTASTSMCNFTLSWSTPFEGVLQVNQIVTGVVFSGSTNASTLTSGRFTVVVTFEFYPVFTDLYTGWSPDANFSVSPFYSNLVVAPVYTYVNPNVYMTSQASNYKFELFHGWVDEGLPDGTQIQVPNNVALFQTMGDNYIDGPLYYKGEYYLVYYGFGSTYTLEMNWTTPVHGQLQVNRAFNTFTVSVIVNFVDYPTGTVFRDLSSEWTVSLNSTQFLAAASGEQPTMSHVDPTLYETRNSSSFLFAVLPLTGISSNWSSEVSFNIPAGTMLSVVDNSCVLSDGLVLFGSDGTICSNGSCPSVVPLCYLQLSWTAPFTGQMIFVQRNQFNLSTPLGSTLSVVVNFFDPFSSLSSTSSLSSSSSTLVSPMSSSSSSGSTHSSQTSPRSVSSPVQVQESLSCRFSLEIDISYGRCDIIGSIDLDPTSLFVFNSSAIAVSPSSSPVLDLQFEGISMAPSPSFSTVSWNWFFLGLDFSCAIAWNGTELTGYYDSNVGSAQVDFQCSYSNVPSSTSSHSASSSGNWATPVFVTPTSAPSPDTPSSSASISSPSLSSSSSSTASFSSSSSTASFSSSSSSTASFTSSLSSVETSSPAAAGNVCILLYSIPGTVDYPFSVAYNITLGDKSSGIRTYTNRFGQVSTTPVIVTPTSSQVPSVTASSGVNFTFSLGTPSALPGGNPSQPVSTINVSWDANGHLVESGSSLLDPFGQAFTSTTFTRTIGASNVNSLAVNYKDCTAPITFVNGLRSPTQPSTFNGGSLVSYSYFITDGVSYAVNTSLILTMNTAFATQSTPLGIPYQEVFDITGTRVYHNLSVGTTVTSSIPGSSFPQQRFYPYSLISSSPGVYSMNTAPFLDSVGLSFNLDPPAPLNGVLYSSVSVFVGTQTGAALLTESLTTLAPPILEAQRQQYEILA